MKYFFFTTLALFIGWIISCSGKPGQSSATTGEKVSAVPASSEPAEKVFTVVAPEENAELRLFEPLTVKLAGFPRNNPPDSLKIWFDGRPAGVIKAAPWEITIPSSFTGRTGRKALRISAFRRGSAIQTITRFMIVYSDTPPARKSYRVITSYPHDRDAFTQGLLFHGGFLYEGTGQEGRSNLRKVKLESGEILSQVNLEPHLFGEGIAIAGDRIYQLTWQTKVGFVYDVASFRLINRIYYQTEGWGLTTMDNKLVMSDGSNILYVLDPDSFTTLYTLEVYDNKAKVPDLNELEFINGEIWANIWQTDLIARIDPGTGKVLAYIDLKGILNDPATDTSVNVLNGIAYDREGKRIFVTGKNWPKLFEIRISE